MIYTVRIEQTYHQQNRMKYIAQTDSFVEKKNVKSLGYVKNIRQPPYGWIKESGTPPCEHLDVYAMIFSVIAAIDWRSVSSSSQTAI